MAPSISVDDIDVAMSERDDELGPLCFVWQMFEKMAEAPPDAEAAMIAEFRTDLLQGAQQGTVPPFAPLMLDKIVGLRDNFCVAWSDDKEDVNQERFLKIAKPLFRQFGFEMTDMAYDVAVDLAVTSFSCRGPSALRGSEGVVRSYCETIRQEVSAAASGKPLDTICKAIFGLLDVDNLGVVPRSQFDHLRSNPNL